MNSNNNKFLLSTSQPFEQSADDKPYEVLDTTSKSTASSPLHVGFENTRMDENIKDYAGTNFDGQELGFDSKNAKPSQFNNVYINNSIALNFTSNNIMSHHEAPNMAKKVKVTSSYSSIQKPQTEQYETRICLNCGEKNHMMQDSYCPACHSSVTAPSKDHYNGVTPGQHEQHMRKDPWSNYVNLAGSQKTENLRINQPKFSPAAPSPNCDPNSYHFLPQNSEALIHPQVQANHDFYFAKQNNLSVQADQGKKFELKVNHDIPLPPVPRNTPKLYEGPNYDEEEKFIFKDELFTAVQDAGNQKGSVNKELFDKLDEMDFEGGDEGDGGDAFSFQNDQNDDDLDNMDGWQEMDFAGPEESSQEKPTMPTVEEKRDLSLAKKKVEVIELSEHDSDKFSAGKESPESSGLRKLLSKEDQKLFASGQEKKDDEEPVDDLISFFIENSSKKTMLFQKEPVVNNQQFSVPGIEEDSSKTVTEENGDSRGKDVNYLSLIRSKSETQSVSKVAKVENKKVHNVQKAEKGGEKGEKVHKEHKEGGRKGSKDDIEALQKGRNGDLLTLLLNKVDDNSNSSLLSAEKTEQIVNSLVNLVNNQTKSAVNQEKKPFVIQNKPREKSIKLGINLHKTSGSFKDKRQEKEKEKDLEREKEREINWEREHEKEREKLKELERQREKKEKEKEEKHKQRQKEKEHRKENHKEKEHKESHKEKEIHKENHKEKEKDKETYKEKVKEKESQKEKEKVKEKPKEKVNKKAEAKMVMEEKEKEPLSEADSEESEYFMFGDEYDMILECYSQESEFVDVHEVKRRMDDFDFLMKGKEEIENIDEILYPRKTVIGVGGEYQTRIPAIDEKNPFGQKSFCKIWDPDRIQRQNYEHFMESLSNITKLPPANIKEEKAVEILVDNNYSVDQALKFANEYSNYVKSQVVYPQQQKKQEKEK